jgi:hypothetical protein
MNISCKGFLETACCSEDKFLTVTKKMGKRLIIQETLKFYEDRK